VLRELGSVFVLEHVRERSRPRIATRTAVGVQTDRHDTRA